MSINNTTFEYLSKRGLTLDSTSDLCLFYTYNDRLKKNIIYNILYELNEKNITLDLNIINYNIIALNIILEYIKLNNDININILDEKIKDLNIEKYIDTFNHIYNISNYMSICYEPFIKETISRLKYI